MLSPYRKIFGVTNGSDAHCNLLNCKRILTLKDGEIHTIHSGDLGALGRRAICVLLGKDKTAPFINLRSQVKNMLVHSS